MDDLSLYQRRCRFSGLGHGNRKGIHHPMRTECAGVILQCSLGISQHLLRMNVLLVEGSARLSQYPLGLMFYVGYQRHLLPSLGCRSEQMLMASFLIIHTDSLPPLTCTHTYATHTLRVLRLYICINAGWYELKISRKITEKWSIPGFIHFWVEVVLQVSTLNKKKKKGNIKEVGPNKEISQGKVNHSSPLFTESLLWCFFTQIAATVDQV